MDSNSRARLTWENKAVGSQRSKRQPDSIGYFEDIRGYRYGYETPFIIDFFEFHNLRNKQVLEVGVGNGIDAGEMMKHGAIYTGLDVTKNHLQLAQSYTNLISAEFDVPAGTFIENDLLEFKKALSFDVVYSFGVLHHIAHEVAYLNRLREILGPTGELRVSFYSKYSFFNCWLILTWVAKNRMSVPLDYWRSHVAEGSPLSQPVVIKIRSKREIFRLLRDSGFDVIKYQKLGFVQNYIPFFGRFLSPNGFCLRFFGSLLGWYHCVICKPRD